MLRSIALSLLTVALPAAAAQITTSTLCGVNDVVISHRSFCHLQSASTGVVSLNASVWEKMNSPFEYEAFVVVGQLAILRPDAIGSIRGRAQAELHGLFTTEGPARSGLLHLRLSFFLEGNDIGTPATWRIGPYSGNQFDVIDAMLPFELNDRFGMDVWNSHSFELPTPGRQRAGLHTVAGNFLFTLYEADGVTPVALIPIAIPEPAGTTVIGLAAFVLFGILRRR